MTCSSRKTCNVVCYVASVAKAGFLDRARQLGPATLQALPRLKATGMAVGLDHRAHAQASVLRDEVSAEVRTRYAVVSVLLLSAFLSGCSPPTVVTDGQPYAYPDPEWRRMSPEEAGFDAEALDAFVEHVGGHGCVVRRGYLVRAWGNHTARADVASAVKPVYTHLLLSTQEAGRIDDLDDRVAPLMPGLNELNADLGYPDREITWRHLATQTSCYGVQERPGEAFDYNDLQIALLSDLLVACVYGSTHEKIDVDLLTPVFSDPIGCQDEPTMSHPRSLPGRLRISVRDFARFGHLYLSRGRWKGRQVLSEEAVRLATSSPLPASVPSSAGVPAEMLPGQRSVGTYPHDARHLNSYSYCWWLNGVMDHGERVLPHAPEDTYGGFGHGGKQALIIVPSLDLVVVWTYAIQNSKSRHFCFGGRWAVDKALRKLVLSVED